jgi:hypothetical protein
MSKIKLLDEKAPGIWRTITRDVEGRVCKVSRKRTVRFDSKEKDHENYVMFEEPGFWRKMFYIGPMAILPMFKTSYKSDRPLKWGETVTVDIDGEKYKQLSEEDSLSELARRRSSDMQMLMWMGIGGAIGFFLSYFLSSGGLDSINAMIG